MTPLALFGLVAVSAMMVCDTLEGRSRWYTFGLSLSCVLASIYGFLQGAWPFGVVEGLWSLLALRRWWLLRATP